MALLKFRKWHDRIFAGFPGETGDEHHDIDIAQITAISEFRHPRSGRAMCKVFTTVPGLIFTIGMNRTQVLKRIREAAADDS